MLGLLGLALAIFIGLILILFVVGCLTVNTKTHVARKCTWIFRGTLTEAEKRKDEEFRGDDE